ncbi:MAG: DUF1667 domain-containing protein [Clostridia bacterium]|nr:DUF1667 domain-containing protein [Clostridia bacterium]
MKRELTCIVCPRGCQMVIELEGKEIKSVAGNFCPRGKSYAETECTHPTRTVTTTAKCSDGGVVSVKTLTPIPKEHMMDCMRIINGTVVALPVRVGDVILEDVFGSRVVATQNRE